ncbi:hypothetical protein NDU88_007047 [Pleurodeles waltl]|uniref:Uncharacterized protein n=1 Tax=Pleurodeles waltl TaxID=8319 RepID=A0AAV7QMU8_PLEWA|nr:hypothetical protein NDU88_007047 [Pleurodeles waltl]
MFPLAPRCRLQKGFSRVCSCCWAEGPGHSRRARRREEGAAAAAVRRTCQRGFLCTAGLGVQRCLRFVSFPARSWDPSPLGRFLPRTLPEAQRGGAGEGPGAPPCRAGGPRWLASCRRQGRLRGLPAGRGRKHQDGGGGAPRVTRCTPGRRGRQGAARNLVPAGNSYCDKCDLFCMCWRATPPPATTEAPTASPAAAAVCSTS